MVEINPLLPRLQRSPEQKALSSPKALKIGQGDLNVFVLKVIDQIFKHFISEEKQGKPAFLFALDEQIVVL